MKKKIWILICLLCLFCFGCGKTPAYFEETDGETEISGTPEETGTEEVSEPETEDKAECYVYVCGAVKNPGVYCLLAGSRIYEAVSMAGGLLEDACEDSINQAEEVSDGQMIRILTAEEAAQQASVAVTEDTSSSGASDGRVNINTADASELMTLPGIGESKAMSILSYREENGGFSSIEEIMNITGIKEGVYSKIKEYITVN